MRTPLPLLCGLLLAPFACKSQELLLEEQVLLCISDHPAAADDDAFFRHECSDDPRARMPAACEQFEVGADAALCIAALYEVDDNPKARGEVNDRFTEHPEAIWKVWEHKETFDPSKVIYLMASDGAVLAEREETTWVECRRWRCGDTGR